MYTCGHIGEQMADQVLMRVPIRLQDPGSSLALQGDIVGVLQEINQVCYEHGREETRRSVCRAAAQMLVREKKYGLAVSYCTSAEDWTGLGLIVDRVLNEYLISGPEKFTEYASTIAPSLQYPIHEGQASQGIFLHRLNFVTRYSRFHRMKSEMAFADASQDLINMLQDDLCPKSWWSVLLYEVLEFLNQRNNSIAIILIKDHSHLTSNFSAEMPFSTKDITLLLSKLQEIVTRSSQGAGEDYLSVFMRAQDLRTYSDALLKLDSVRFTLAKYYAQCSIVGVGGKSVFSHMGTRQSVF
jgi:nuclear pore complex protein Nup85